MTCNPNVIPLEFISRGGNGGWFEMGLQNFMDARYMKNYTGKSEMSPLTQGIRRDHRKCLMGLPETAFSVLSCLWDGSVP